MDDFRAVFDLPFSFSPEPFHVHVISFAKIFDYPVNVPGGTANYFIYFVQDPVEMRTGDGIVAVPAHTMIVYPPGTPMYLNGGPGPWRHSWLRCSGSAVAGMIERSGVPCCRAIGFADSELNRKFLTEIYREQTFPGGGDAVNLEYWFRLWMRNVGRHLRHSGTTPVPEAFRRAREYLSARYLESFRLDELARRCGVSRSHLCKGFRRWFGCPPLEFAIRLRLQHAAEMLSDGDLNISEVAQRSGFADVFYFSRLFRKHLGVSPLRFRRQLGGGVSSSVPDSSR